MTRGREPVLRSGAAASFFVLWIALQLVIPLTRGDHPRPTRFAWQMYSDVRLAPALAVETSSGARTPVSATENLGNRRIDLDWEDADLGVVCRAVPDAVRVHAEWRDGRALPPWSCGGP